MPGAPPAIGDPLPPEHPRLAALYDFWLMKAAGRPMPLRREIDTLELVPWMGHLNLIETIGAAEDFYFRVHGTELVPNVLLDMTGKRLSQSPSPFRVPVMAEYQVAWRAARPMRIARIDRPDRHHNRWEKLILPLTRDEGTADFFLTAGYPTPDSLAKRES